MEWKAILGVALASFLASVLYNRWSNQEKGTTDLTKLEGKLEKEVNERKLEIRRLEISIEANEKLGDKLARRWHNMRRKVDKCLWKLGIEDKDDED